MGTYPLLSSIPYSLFPRADAKSLRQSLTHQFCLVFGGEAAKTKQKILRGRLRRPRTPTGSDFALALCLRQGDRKTGRQGNA